MPEDKRAINYHDRLPARATTCVPGRINARPGWRETMIGFTVMRKIRSVINLHQTRVGVIYLTWGGIPKL